MHGDGDTVSILVVEDDVAVAELIRTILNQVPGWGSTVVHDAAAAREVFRHVQIEVLVMDVNLPGISGLELLTLLRQDPHWNESPVLLMSAQVNQPGIAGALREGLVTRFLRKPFDVDELVRQVHAAIADHPLGARLSDRPEGRQGAS
jgi:DNA-binding response OmpR family regulator